MPAVGQSDDHRLRKRASRLEIEAHLDESFEWNAAHGQIADAEGLQPDGERILGARGGSIAVKGPRADIEDRLPETVEDHWRYFKDDPNFKNWMAAPRYRVVMEPTEQDRKLVGAIGAR